MNFCLKEFVAKCVQSMKAQLSTIKENHLKDEKKYEESLGDLTKAEKRLEELLAEEEESNKREKILEEKKQKWMAKLQQYEQ